MSKTVLITGASRGIGKATAIKFAQEGYNVIITCKNNEDKLMEVGARIASYGVKCAAFLGDAANPELAKMIYEDVHSMGLEVDVLVNNAGISYVGLIQDMSMEQWNEVINTNLTSAFVMTKCFIQDMITKKNGKIINISSVWGENGSSMEVAYCTSKGGLNMFTKALAKEVAPSRIQVNAIACGIIDTDMNAHLSEDEKRDIVDSIPVGRMGRPEDIAENVYNLATSGDYLTGQIIKVDGGWM